MKNINQLKIVVFSLLFDNGDSINKLFIAKI